MKGVFYIEGLIILLILIAPIFLLFFGIYYLLKLFKVPNLLLRFIVSAFIVGINIKWYIGEFQKPYDGWNYGLLGILILEYFFVIAIIILLLFSYIIKLIYQKTKQYKEK